MIANHTKEKLFNGDPVFGCFVRSADATFAEYLATTGWDFLVFDGEHGAVDLPGVGDLARACESRGVSPMVRVSANESSIVLRCLDAGAAGIHVPWIRTVDDARTAVASAKYPPQGERGLAGNRSTDWMVTSEALAHANRETMVVAQVETQDAVDRIDELCLIDGVDVLFIGPSDLSSSLGFPGQLSHPAVVEAIRRVADAVRASGKYLGMFAGTQQAAHAALDVGAVYVATGAEGLIGGASRSFLGSLRERD